MVKTVFLKFNLIFVLVLIFVISIIPSSYSATIEDLHANSLNVIYIDDNGGECNEIGKWNKNSRTCLLTQDVEKFIRVIGSDLTIDGNDHHVQIKKKGSRGPNIGSIQGDSIIIGIHSRVKNVILKNLIVEGSSGVFRQGSGNGVGIHVAPGARNIIVENSEFFSLRNAINSNYCEIKNNKIFSNNIGLYADFCKIFQNNIQNNKVGITIAHENIIKENILKNNDKGIKIDSFGNTITHNMIQGNAIPFYSISHYNGRNIISNNNFLEYAQNPVLKSSYDIIEENYWDSFDSNEEGCKISLSSNFCQNPFVFGNFKDPNPWKVQNGWLIDFNMPEDIKIKTKSPDGKSISYLASASGSNGKIDILCNPSSDSLFPIGTTQVICSTPNGVASSFFVTVLDENKIIQKQQQESFESGLIRFLKLSSLVLGIFLVILIFKARKRKNKLIKESRSQSSQYHQNTNYQHEQTYQREYKENTNSYTSQSTSDSKDYDLHNLSKEDAFEILEVSEASTSQEIKNSRNRLINQWHPDKHKTPLYQNIAEKQTKLIIASYELLRKLRYVD